MREKLLILVLLFFTGACGNVKVLKAIFKNSSKNITSEQVTPDEIKKLQVSVAGTKSINLSWNGGGGTTAGYVIAYSEGNTSPSDCNQGISINVGDVTSYEVTGLTPNLIYSFRVCSLNGNISPDHSSG